HTYVSAGRGSRSASPEAVARRQILAQSGVARVVEHERQHRRNPEDLSERNLSYDVVSRDADGNVLRYIEVKASPGAWEDSPVTLTLPEFKEALKRGEQ